MCNRSKISGAVDFFFRSFEDGKISESSNDTNVFADLNLCQHTLYDQQYQIKVQTFRPLKGSYKTQLNNQKTSFYSIHKNLQIIQKPSIYYNSHDVINLLQNMDVSSRMKKFRNKKHGTSKSTLAYLLSTKCIKKKATGKKFKFL